MLYLIFSGIESETEVCTAKQVQNNRVFSVQKCALTALTKPTGSVLGSSVVGGGSQVVVTNFLC